MINNVGENAVKPLLCDISFAGHLLNVRRSTVYKLLNNGSLESVKIGSRRLIRMESIYAIADGGAL